MKRITINTMLRYLIIGILLPVFVQYVVYFRFTSNYMLNIFSEKSFTDFYGKNVFRYRVLGKDIHLWIYHQLKKNDKTKNYKDQAIYEKRLTALDPDADPVFHLTYFIEATIFSILAALALLYLFDTDALFEMSELKKITLTSGLTMLTGFLEFVITPYDNLTYFFLIFSVLLFLLFLQKRQWIYFILLNLTIVLATLNHESSLIIVSFMAAVYFSRYGFTPKWLRFMILPVVCFLVTYIGLRYFLIDNGPVKVAQELKLWVNINLLTISGIMGFVFPTIAFYTLLKTANNPVNKKMIWNFLLATSPYIILMPFIGILVEARLWVPVIIGGVLIGQLNYNSIRLPAIAGAKNEESKRKYSIT